MSCIICKKEDVTDLALPGSTLLHQSCMRCGQFKISDITIIMDSLRPKLSGWIRDQNYLGDIPRINHDTLKYVETIPALSVAEKMDRLLRYCVRKNKLLSDSFDIDDICVAVTYSVDFREVKMLARYLADVGFIEHTGSFYRIKPAGHLQVEKLSDRHTMSSQGFVAMWFDESMIALYREGLEVAIRNAGYDPLRVDSVEHTGKIDDEIISQIRKSRFLVADFTNHRGGVYFEAGFALGLNLPVFWTCKKNDVESLHFDIRQYNTLT